MGYFQERQPPALAPLRHSAEFDEIERDLKAIFIAVFEEKIRPRERELNLYGMPHLGGITLLEQFLKLDGLAAVRRDVRQIRFLMRVWRGRNAKRGLRFLRSYLQIIFPNEWAVYQLWHPQGSIAHYPRDCTLDTGLLDHVLTSRVRVGIHVAVASAADVQMTGRALRSVLAARLLLEMVQMIKFASRFGMANAACGIAPLYAVGVLKR